MSKKRYMKKDELKAVHEDELEQFLSSLNLLEPIKSGQITCTQCNIIISLENLGLVYPMGNNIHFLCNSAICLSEAELEGISKDG